MFGSIIKYELGYWLKAPITYIIGTIFFGFTFIMMIGTGGYFDGPIEASESVRLMNSPHEINYMLQYLTKLLLFIIPVFIGQSIYRDYKSRVFNLTYAYPISKRDYLLGKFLSAFIIVLIVSFLIGSAFVLGELVLTTENPKISSFRLGSYFQSFAYFLIPNLFVISLIVFVVVTISRNIFTGFFVILFIFLLQSITQNLFTGNPDLISLFDPLGQRAMEYSTRNWNLSDMNTSSLPLNRHVVLNRVFWITTSLAFFYLFFRKFSFSHESSFLSGLSFRKSAKSIIKTRNKENEITKVSEAATDFSFLSKLKRTWELSNYDFKFLISNWSFFVIAISGMFTVVFMLLKITMTGELNRLPVTWLMLSAPLSLYMLILMLATFLFSGMLMNRASSTRMNFLIDASPVDSTILYFSKLIAMLKLHIVLLLILFLGGLIIQTINGFGQYEIGLYLFHLCVLCLPVLFIWAVYALFVHTIIPNLFIALFVLILTWVGISGLDHIGIDTQLLKFNTPPVINYSDLNGYGINLKGQILVILYWLILTPILIGLSILFWNRGLLLNFRERLKLSRDRMTKPVFFICFLSLVGFIGLGAKIFQEERKSLSDLKFQKFQKNNLSSFKNKFQVYKSFEEPKITSIELDLDLSPETNSFHARGTYHLKNTSSDPIDTILIRTGFDEMTSFKFAQAFSQIELDTFMNHYVCVLDKAIQPGSHSELSFEVKNKQNTWFQNNSNIYSNGTMLKHDILPRFGYVYDQNELSPEDSLANNKNFYYADAGMVDINTTIRTSLGQFALAPGELVKQFDEKNKSVYIYKTDQKTKFNFSFHSGDFDKKIHPYLNKSIETYTHHSHQINLDSMILGIKAALDYNTKYFTPYPYQTFRIVEFPHVRESFGATLMANNIPTSETLYNINTEVMYDKINLPFYVMAHELTHEWFGNKVMPADALGAKMLTEGITEYISLRIYKEILGNEKAQNFLKTQHDRYLRGRHKEEKKEHPLFKIRSDQQYIAYGKGAVAFNTIAHYIGEQKLNEVLKTFVLKYENKENQFPTTLDFLNLLEAEMPEEFLYLIEDYFKKTMMHEVQILSADLRSLNNNYATTVSFSFNQTINNQALSDIFSHIEIGLFGDENELEVIDVHKVSDKNNSITIVTKLKPDRVVLDPNLLLIEKDRSDNTLELDK